MLHKILSTIKKKFHQNTPVTVINAYATGNPFPLGDGKYETIKSSIHIERDKTKDGRVIKSPGIAVDNQTVTTTDGQVNKLVNISMQDAGNVPIHLIFDFIADEIHNCLLKDLPIYIDCQRGISRFTSLLLAYLAKYSSYQDANSAITDLQLSRSQIAPNLGFYIKLDMYFKTCAANRTDEYASIKRPVLFREPVTSDMPAPAVVAPDSRSYVSVM